jgi:ABC-type transport system involved in multi-copper enzyme maturation permease subunit
MKQQLKTQFYLMFSQKFFYVISAILIVMSVSLQIASSLASEVVDIPDGVSFTSFTSLISGITDFSVTEILCAVLAALFFGAEMKNRTVNIALCAGVSRFHYWLSKSVVYVFAGFIIAVLYPLTLCIVGTFTAGFGAEASLGGFYFVRLFLMYFTAVIAAIGVYEVFSAIFSSTSAVVLSSLGFLFLSRIVIQIFPIFVKGSEKVIGFLPTQSVVTMIDPEISLPLGLTISGINIASAVILFAVSYLIFGRKELK